MTTEGQPVTDLIHNRQMPDDARPSVSLGELRAVYAAGLAQGRAEGLAELFASLAAYHDGDAPSSDVIDAADNLRDGVEVIPRSVKERYPEMTHTQSAHCPCGPKSEVVWPDGDLRDRVQDAIDHAGSEVDPTDPDEGVTPELLFHALAEAGVRLEVVR